MTWGDVVVLGLAVVLVVGALLVVRSGTPAPWPAIGLAALTSGICFTVGGDADPRGGGPSVPIVLGGIVGVVAVASMIRALAPKQRTDRPPSPLPALACLAATVAGALALVISQLVV